MKQRRCHELGLEPRIIELPSTATTVEATAAVSWLSADPEVDAILVQHPAPRHIDERAVFEAIAPSKDVDG